MVELAGLLQSRRLQSVLAEGGRAGKFVADRQAVRPMRILQAQHDAEQAHSLTGMLRIRGQ